MSVFSKFVVVGATDVKGTVVDELLEKGATVTILTRDDSKSELKVFKDRGIKLVKVLHGDENVIEKALTGSEVIYADISHNSYLSERSAYVERCELPPGYRPIVLLKILSLSMIASPYKEFLLGLHQ